MSTAIKAIGESADKWSRRSSVAGMDYQRGVENPRTAWSTAAAAADSIYRAAVIAAANAGRFAKGIKQAGEAKWRENAIKKGPGRFAEGVALAVDEWQKGYAPYQAAISALTLPARGPRGSPQNLQRVAAVSVALRQVFERAA